MIKDINSTEPGMKIVLTNDPEAPMGAGCEFRVFLVDGEPVDAQLAKLADQFKRTLPEVTEVTRSGSVRVTLAWGLPYT